jgi:hypothetical protein
MKSDVLPGARTWIATLMVLTLTVTAAAAGKWVFLGERVVNDRLDHDTIKIDSDVGQLSALKIKVGRRAVQFRDMKVHFANGGVQDVELRKVIPAGGASRVIDLRGDDRVVKKVEFWYDAQTPRRGKKSVIRLFGRR